MSETWQPGCSPCWQCGKPGGMRATLGSGEERLCLECLEALTVREMQEAQRPLAAYTEPELGPPDPMLYATWTLPQWMVAAVLVSVTLWVFVVLAADAVLWVLR